MSDTISISYETIKRLLKRPVSFHPVFAKLVESASGGLFLSQLYYWSTSEEEGKTKGGDPNGWIYKTLKDWSDETYISRKEWENARKRLRDLGLLEEQQRGMNRQIWYKLNLDYLYQKIASNGAPTQTSDRAVTNVRSSGCKRQIERLQTSDRAVDLYTENTYHRIHSENTHTHPERAIEQILEAQIIESEPEPEPIELPSKPVLNQPIPSSNPDPRKEVSSGACRTTETTSITPTGYLADIEKRYSPTLSRLETTELTQRLIDTYNRSKPSSWGTCTKMSAFLVKQTEALVKIYSDRLEIDEAIESLVNDFAAAHLGMRGDKFYDSPSFGISSIAFFFDAKRTDALQSRAQVWYDKPQQAKVTTAKTMANEIQKGVPCHETGQILSSGSYHSRARRFAKNIKLPKDHEIWGNMPDMDHLHKYYPQIFEAN